MANNEYFKSKFSCKAPWLSLSIRNNNQLSICSNSSFSSHTPPGSTLSAELNSADIQSYRFEHFTNSPLDSCRVCTERNQLGVRAQRDALNELELKADLDGSISSLSPADLLLLDLNLSNVCNLKCRMCSSLRSSSWKDDQKWLSERLAFIKPPEVPQNPHLTIDLEKFSSLRYLILKGGEPLFDKSSRALIRKLVELGYAKKIVLTIFTNGVYAEQSLPDLKEFGEINLVFSFEGTGGLYSYIRGGVNDFNSFHKAVRAAAVYKNIYTTFMYTPQAYNIFDLPRAVEFVDSISKDFFCNKLSATDINTSFGNILLEPSFLAINSIPENLRLKALQQIQRSASAKLLNWTGIEQLLLAPFSEENYRNFLLFTKHLDTLRDENIFQAVPEFKDSQLSEDYYHISLP
jgi:hypothetical protein